MEDEKPQDEKGVVAISASECSNNTSTHETALQPTEAEPHGHHRHSSTADTLIIRKRAAMPDLGKTTVFASRHDPRFCYSLYVPPDHFASSTTDTAPALIVVVHDSGRGFLEYRDGLAEFGRWNNVSLLTSNNSSPPLHSESRFVA